ncbi:MAG TPA: NAD(+) diphosphatase [Thermodesulfovibrionales bacterium]|nr:NAD(+) diphosphatase [Thermodesulfovibrionales bacterium]
MRPTGQSGKNRFFIFRGDRLLVQTAGKRAEIPGTGDVPELTPHLQRTHYLGTFGGAASYAAEVAAVKSVPEGMSFEELRPLLGLLDEETFSVAGRAFQILYWDKTHRFCGRCGSPTEQKSDERARECPQCGLVVYPEVSPAIIVAVTKGREILLARARRFTGNFYSVLAGFVEPGETFEECVAREVMEEAGVDVAHIRYFGSQPWPFPHSLMVGFTADYTGGRITVEEAEIVEARWFRADALPDIPRTGTIARRLIDWFIERSEEGD